MAKETPPLREAFLFEEPSCLYWMYALHLLEGGLGQNHALRYVWIREVENPSLLHQRHGIFDFHELTNRNTAFLGIGSDGPTSSPTLLRPLLRSLQIALMLYALKPIIQQPIILYDVVWWSL